MTALLELRNAAKVYGGGLFRRRSTVALRDCWLAMGGEKPTILSIAGESGSGKTTMGMLLLGFIEPSEGQVLYKGEDLWHAPKDAWREYRREIQAIFQD
nr:ATP-binding cassette domain-containing protein [Anaerolineae bacterium]